MNLAKRIAQALKPEAGNIPKVTRGHTGKTGVTDEDLYLREGPDETLLTIDEKGPDDKLEVPKGTPVCRTANGIWTTNKEGYVVSVEFVSIDKT